MLQYNESSLIKLFGLKLIENLELIIVIKELKWESEILKKKITEFRFEKLENNK